MRVIGITLLLIVFLSAKLFASTSNVDSLLTQLNELEKNSIHEAKILSKIGTEYYLFEDYSQALDYNSRALNIYKAEENQEGIGKVYKNIADLYSEINDYDSALKYYLDALTISENLDDPIMIAHINFDLGRLFIKLENYKKALEKISSSLSFYEKDSQQYKDVTINAYANIGITYGKLESLDSALIFFNKALAMYPEEDLVNKGGVLNNIGAIYFKQDLFEDALRNYEKSLQYFESAEDSKGIGIALFNIAKTYVETKDIEQAERVFEESIPYLEKGNSLYYLYNCYKELSLFNEEKDNIPASLRYYKLYTEAKDSIMNIETLNKVASLQIQYNVRKEELKIELLEKDNKIKTIQKYILIASIIILVIVGLLFYRFFKTKIKNNKLKQEILQHEKKQLKSELDYKNKEIETFALQIIQKNEFLESLKNEIKTVNTDSSKLREISVNISQNLYLEKDREEFQNHVDNIHQAFFHKLDNKYPDLSKSDKRLCSLLAIDLSTKDIATIINISPESVKKSRYRLRKKLSLDTEENLSDFLKNI